MLDGVFTEAPNGALRFHNAAPPSDADIAALLATIRKRILRHLERHGMLHDDQADPFSDESPLLANCYATSIAHRQTLGKWPGTRLHRIGDPDAARAEHRAPMQAHIDRFDLHAGLTIAAQHAHGRLALEKLLRYCARPPIAQDRLHELPDGRIQLQLKTPWSDGTTHVIYEALDLIAKLAALIPRPHKNLILYHGVLAANAAWRKRAVAYGRDALQPSELGELGQPIEPPQQKPRQWADLMRRAFGCDLLSCPNCGGKMRLLACIIERGAIRKILTHLGLPPDPPLPRAPAPLPMHGSISTPRPEFQRTARLRATSVPNTEKSQSWDRMLAAACALPRGKITSTEPCLFCRSFIVERTERSARVASTSRSPTVGNGRSGSPRWKTRSSSARLTRCSTRFTRLTSSAWRRSGFHRRECSIPYPWNRFDDRTRGKSECGSPARSDLCGGRPKSRGESRPYRDRKTSRPCTGNFALGATTSPPTNSASRANACSSIC